MNIVINECCPTCGATMGLRARILSDLREHPSSTSVAVAGRLSVRQESCRREMLAMRGDDLIRETGLAPWGKKGGRAVLWLAS
jgi:hypothetical protein